MSKNAVDNVIAARIVHLFVYGNSSVDRRDVNSSWIHGDALDGLETVQMANFRGRNTIIGMLTKPNCASN